MITEPDTTTQQYIVILHEDYLHSCKGFKILGTRFLLTEYWINLLKLNGFFLNGNKTKFPLSSIIFFIISPCLQATVLWEDSRKKFGSHLTTSAVDADLLRKRILLFTSFVNDHYLRGPGEGYLALQPQLDGAIMQ